MQAIIFSCGVDIKLLTSHLPQNLSVIGIIGLIRMPIAHGFTLGDVALVVSVLVVAVLIILIVKERKKRNSAVTNEKILINEKELLDKLSRLKVELYQNMYHDLKTPLTVVSTSILNLIDMIEFDEINGEEMHKSLSDMQNETMYMSRMLDNAMKLSASTIEQSDLLFVPINMSEFIEEKSEIYRILLARSKNKLILELAPSLPNVLVCPDMILHVLTNLLTNANRYTRAGEITICVKEESDDISILVRDNGSGIRDEFLPLIFERGASDGGSGLGLAICKTVVEKTHGGKIFATSKVGEGTTIKFTLPKAA